MMSSFTEHFRTAGVLNRQGSEGREMSKRVDFYTCIFHLCF